MTGIVRWAADRARMVIAFIIISLLVGGFAYSALPKEGEPDIEIPAVFISVEFPGISAEDAETLLVKVMETELADLDGLDEMEATAAEGYAGVGLLFEFGWDKSATLADIRDAMDTAEAEFPEGAEKYHLTEINFSEFPIVIVNLSGAVPERTMTRLANNLQDDLEALDAVLEAGIAGKRDEMVEVLIDPLRLEAYNVTALELIEVVQNNNQLIAAGEVDSAQGAFAVKIPSTFENVQDIYELPIKTNGDRVITLGELAEINFTFEDRTGTARFDGEKTVALQVVKRKGYNLIDTVNEVKAAVAKAQAKWPEELQAAVKVGTSNDQSNKVSAMVSQLEGSVLTAIALVMIVVLSALGSRAALLVGFAIPTSFLLCFAFLAMMGISISNIVMFGLILAVGMLVDGAIVVVEYADKRIKEGVGPMHAYVEAAQRMFWPIVSSTATTLCAFLPMLFWPGVPGEFMGMLPVTLIFVLSASLVVALIYLPVMGGVSGRMSRSFGIMADALRTRLPWVVRAALVVLTLLGMFTGAMQMLNPTYIMPEGASTAAALIAGGLLFMLSAFGASVALSSVERQSAEENPQAGFKLNLFGHFIKLIAGNPVMPVVTLLVVGLGISTVFGLFQENNHGVDFFVKTEPEQATGYVLGRGNLSLAEKDEMVKITEEIIASHPAVINVFSFAGQGGLNTDSSGASTPPDTVGQVQFEIIPWDERPKQKEKILWGLFNREVTATEFDGDYVMAELNRMVADIAGFDVELRPLVDGPAAGKPVHLRIKGDDWGPLREAAMLARAKFEETPALIQIEDSLPLPGIDWVIDVDVAMAGRYGADVATVGAMVQLVTRGILLGEMRVDGADDEIEIRTRLPEQDRVLSTLDSLKVPTANGPVPLSNFITRRPVPKLAQIDRIDQQRFYDVKADFKPGLSKVVTGLDDDEVELALIEVVADESLPAQHSTNNGERFNLFTLSGAADVSEVIDALDGDGRMVPINANERIVELTKWLETNPFDASLSWEWTGDQEEQAESGAFLSKAFAGALALMFVILLAQFNSFYNSILVLLAVVLSTTGVLIGMMVMAQPFSIIMTGTGIVALAGIVVNNNIVLIDTYQEYCQSMPRIEAIIRTAQARIRPVLLTTITTMAGLAPMMFGVSLDFINGGYTIDSPTALWWKQLATAVVFGLGIATFLTLLVTPSLLAIRVWVTTYAAVLARVIGNLSGGSKDVAAQDRKLERDADQITDTEIFWEGSPKGKRALKAAE
ncbi:AcrB/AcrD/AcrF family protein [Epibacterium sp. SM1969]|uniref:AcrB/AcrD/AcrF family protein n=1 Tax=Tritonibacter aquimaris TaxID=2663379 RepID=A0A844ANN2_9RHOB|nr:efflux RND transporter permease subunit [Tritonibacter aquimaris]MQY44285.1 AcrB/AcrD/AcrF family protein [Tritonibacter aquimaris]